MPQFCLNEPRGLLNGCSVLVGLLGANSAPYPQRRMDGVDILIIVGRVLLVFVLLLLTTVFNVWLERKVIADMQNRVGPDRAGPWGLLQTLADGLKLFFKEQITPRQVQYGIFVLAPFLAVIPAFLLFMVVPFGRPFTINGREVIVQGADLNVGILFALAMSSLAVYAVVLAGWSSGSKYPLLGGVRATAQAISYEAAMGLAMVSVVMFSSTSATGGSLSLNGHRCGPAQAPISASSPGGTSSPSSSRS